MVLRIGSVEIQKLLSCCRNSFYKGLGGRSLVTNLRCYVVSMPSYFARSRRMQITKFTPFSTSIKEADSTAQIPQTAYQIMQKIRDLEALPFLHDCRSRNSKEQKWFNEYLDKKLTGEALSKKVNKLETRNSRSPLETPRFSSAQVLDCTEKWIKEYIIGMNLCPYASGYANKRSVHVVQTFGLFAPTEYVKLHAQHLLAEKEVVVKLIIFPARVNYTAFTEMYDFMTRTEGLDNLIQSDLIKMDMFHPEALSPYFLDDDPRQFIRRSPFATIQLTRLKEQKKIVKDWERKHGREASLTSTGLKKIDSIIEENQFNFSKKSAQGLQFLLHTYIPETVIICPDSIPFADR